MPIESPVTLFSRDVQGRYLCNALVEVNAWQSAGGRPFDFIVVGGGTFGAAIAEHLWFRQRERGGGSRVLVIDAGLYSLPEHVQNTGVLGLVDPPEISFDPNAQHPLPPRGEVWGLPWAANIPFKGLAYTLGGRSLYWGGWSPRLLPQELAGWPPATVEALQGLYFDESTRQIGVDETNDFVYGELHNVLRGRLFGGVGSVPAAIPLAQLPPSPLLKPGVPVHELLGLADAGGLTTAQLEEMLKLEAPLAVQARAPHAGFFPLNKFSTVPLLMKAARTASGQLGSNDATKEFMVLPGTHVTRLRVARNASGTWRVLGADTSQGFIELAANGTAVIALGTVESARLAQVSFAGTGIPSALRMGKNLIAHLRSNLTFRVPRSQVPGLSAATGELQTCALFLKCRAEENGNHLGYFHLQITATGGADAKGGGAEDELFKKVPDIDFFDQLRRGDDSHVAFAIRGIGEMQPADPADPQAHASRVDISELSDEYGIPRARVTLQEASSGRDRTLWNVMNRTMLDVAKLLATGLPATLPIMEDGLGTTHHEAGTLWMGDDPDLSVTDAQGRFHWTENLYAAGPCLFPTIGSPNPMLTGIAMARYSGDSIITPLAFQPDPGFTALFDGHSLTGWQMSTIRNQPGRDQPGTFVARRGALEGRSGTDLGMLWFKQRTPARYVLSLEWMMTAPHDNSGVFVGFPDPETEGYDNTSYVAVNIGLEIQIDELARPDNAPVHRTAAIYSFKAADDGPLVVRPPGEWNRYEITVDGANFTVALNGIVVNRFMFAGDPQSPRRALASSAQDPRFIGLQTHTGTVLFRRIQWKAL